MLSPIAPPCKLQQAVLRAFGIDTAAIKTQKVVLEMGGGRMPKLYVQAIGFLSPDQVDEIESELVKVVPTLVVTDSCEVIAKR